METIAVLFGILIVTPFVVDRCCDRHLSLHS
jgi:hypothetical protein